MTWPSSVFHPSILSLACALVAATSQAADVRAAGTVRDLKGAPVPGVIVSITGSDAIATTDAAGAWSLEAGTNAVVRVEALAAPLGVDGLYLEDGRIRASFHGRDLQGRGAGKSPVTLGGWAPRQAHSAAATDTLVFKKNGKVFLRDTISAARTGIVRTFDTTWNAAIIYGWIHDVRGGKVYRSVKIGSQVWMAENLGFAGEGIVIGVCAGAEDSCTRYGRLYKWTEMMALSNHYDTTLLGGSDKVRGICPSGWHVPSKAEWTELQTAVDPDNSYDGNYLKSPFFWQGSSHGDDRLGFRALPGGRYDAGGSLEEPGAMGYWWSRAENFRTSAESLEMYSHNDNTMFGSINKRTKHSVRCLMD